MEIEAVNRAERVRKRAWKQAHQGEFRLLAFAQEVHTMKDVGETIWH